MPYSRVGVMPEPARCKYVKGFNTSKGNRTKGITMEDLKKQTALRLAHEQNEPHQQQKSHIGASDRQQGGQFHPRNINNDYAYGSSDPSALNPRQVHNRLNYTSQHKKEYAQNGISNNNLNAENEQQYLLSQEQHQYHNQHQHSGNHMNYTPPPQDQNVIPSGSPTEDHRMESNHMGNYTQSVDPQMLSRTTQPLQHASSVRTSPDNMHLQYQHPPTFCAPDGSFRSTMTRNNSNTSKNKLPHGLTVYELKEMTKARLQSEAAEKSDEIQETCRDRVSPLDFDSGDSMREQALSRDSSPGGQINNNLVESYLQNQQVAPRVVQAQPQPQAQMLQSGFHPSSSMLGVGAAPSSFRATYPRTDTWESTSVASHNSTIYSENLGSESTSEVCSFGHSNHRNRAFTNPAVQPAEPLDVTHTSMTSAIYKESRSFSSPSPVQASPRRGAGVIGGTSLFNAAVGGNRRRAVTLSPNTDSILEDKPFRYDTFESGDRLEIPNFSAGMSSATGLSATPTQTRQREYSPVLEQLGLDNSYLSNGTQSSSVFRSLAKNNMSPLPGISQIGSRELDSLHGFQSITKNKSDLFSEVSTIETMVAAAPPGFVAASASPSGNTAFSRVGSMDSYSNINRSHLFSEDNLLSDFGSVLDLSGPRADRERANTYTFGSKQSNSNNANLSGGFPF